MSIYVDPISKCAKKAGFSRWRWDESCHMFADSLEELHRFAAMIGMKRSWFQMGRTGIPHYDLTRRRRVEAVKAGAIELTTISETVDLFVRLRFLSISKIKANTRSYDATDD